MQLKRRQLLNLLASVLLGAAWGVHGPSAGYGADAAPTAAPAPATANAPKPAFDRAYSGRLAMVVGRILEGLHYKQSPLNDAISETFFKNYLDALDYTHLVFLQSDVDELQKRYATALDDITRRNDTRPAFEIFSLYLKRLAERHTLVGKLLQEKPDFNTDETMLRQRNKAPWPKDDIEAESLWRTRIKYELLQDQLAKLSPARTNTASATKTSASVAKTDSLDPAKKIQKRYDRLLRDMKAFEDEEIVQAYLGALSRAYDPHTEYFGPSEAANFDINHIKLSLSGIGARLRSEDGFTRIENLVPGGPADLSKQLKFGDRIVAVAQGEGESVDVIDMKLPKVVDLIRGPRATEVRLTIVPAESADESERRIVVLIRDEIKLKEQFAKAKIVDHQDPGGKLLRIGVVSLPQFYDHCTGDIEKLIGRLKQEKVAGIILDLRRNGGGLLDEAVSLSGLFIEEGPIVQVRDNRRETKVYEDTDPKISYDGPLVLLVSRLSASASEIIAAALQDHGRALIVGDQSTHGKGTVQSMLSLTQFIRGEGPDPGKLKLTVSKFYRIAGGTTQKNGVTPDIVLPSLYDYMEIGEAHLPNPLPADQIDPLRYQRLRQSAPPLTTLRARSQERTALNQDFAYLREDIERVKRQRDEKIISVNLQKLKSEREELDAREKVRKEERAARKTPEEKSYAISIEMVDEGKPLVATTRIKQKEDSKLASVGAAAAEPSLDPDDEEAEPATDPQLDETLRILTDLLTLPSTESSALTANGPSKP